MSFGFKNITSAIVVVENSGNSKLGNMSATYAPRQTCPESCPMKDECYAKTSFTGGIFKRITDIANTRYAMLRNDNTAMAQELARFEAAKIDKLTGKRHLRVHVSGDVYDAGSAYIIAQAMMKYTQKHGKMAWTMTHTWKHIPREVWGGVPVLASVENERTMDAAIRKGYSCMMVVDGHMTGEPYESNGITYIPCKHDVKGTQCVDCELCGHIGTKERCVILVAKIKDGKDWVESH